MPQKKVVSACVDSGISTAGGPILLVDRQALTLVKLGIRCDTDSAVFTGPNSYDKLHTSNVIHDYWTELQQREKLE